MAVTGVLAGCDDFHTDSFFYGPKHSRGPLKRRAVSSPYKLFVKLLESLLGEKEVDIFRKPSVTVLIECHGSNHGVVNVLAIEVVRYAPECIVNHSLPCKKSQTLSIGCRR